MFRSRMLTTNDTDKKDLPMTNRSIAALYLRTAAENQAAILDQRRLCTDYATAQGWVVDEVFVDDGVSGLRDDRTGLNALRACIETGQVQIVLATDPARIARDWTIIDDLARLYAVNDVRLAYAKTQPDLPSVVELPLREERQPRARIGCTIKDEDLR